MNPNESGYPLKPGGQLTAEKFCVEIGGGTLVYRRFGITEAEPALLCPQHFRGNLDLGTQLSWTSLIHMREGRSLPRRVGNSF
jgi:hypothetical protein